MSGVEHAVLAPSSAARRWACPGSRIMEASQPAEQESPEAAEGTAAHWVLSQLIQQGAFTPVGTIAPNGFPSDGEMMDGALLCVEHAANVLGADWQQHAISEAHVTMHATIHPLCDGTPDIYVVNRQARRIYLWDYKYGHGYVDVFENPQLVEYLAGIVELPGLSGLDDQQWAFRCFIVQPRNFHRDGPIREWSGKVSDLRALFNLASSREHAAMQPDAPTTAGPEQCRDCRARHACDTLQRASASVMTMAGSNVPFDPPPHAVGRELREVDRALKLLEARRTGLAGQAEQYLAQGKRIPFYHMERSKPREKWLCDVETVKQIGAMYGVELTVEKPITPEQARKLKVDEAVISSYAVRPPGALQLAPLDPSSAAKVFS